jgi:hypothetical protein
MDLPMLQLGAKHADEALHCGDRRTTKRARAWGNTFSASECQGWH